MISRYRKSALTALALVLAVPSAQADPIADFYRGKEMRIVVRVAPGGGYDSLSRLLARHMIRYMPGPPSAIVAVNMPGAGGIIAANFVANVAPKDGTVLTIIGQGLPAEQALGQSPGFTADLRTFPWIGNMSKSNQVIVTWHTSSIRTLADVDKIECAFGSTGGGSIGEQIPAVYNYLLGTKFKIIPGYPGSREMDLAMERGEICARINTVQSWSSTTSYVRDKKINFVTQIGLVKDPLLPASVPLLNDLVKTEEQRAIAGFISNAVAVGRPVTTTPGVPLDRLQTLRKAFDQTMQDTEFRADAARQSFDLDPQSGVELEQLVNSVLNTPADILSKVGQATRGR